MDYHRHGRVNRFHPVKPLILVIVLGGACACTGFNQKDAAPSLVEIQARADAAYQKADYAAAEKQYAVLAREAPSAPLNWFRLANIYAQTNRPEAAIAAYRQALARDPGFSEAWYNMGLVQLKEATHSLLQLQTYTREDQPLYDQSRKIVDGVLNLLNENNETGE